MNNNKDQCLQNLFQHLNKVAKIESDEWKNFVVHCQLETIKKSQFFFVQNDSNLKVGFLMQGLMHSYYTDPSGKQFIKNFSWEGRAIGAWTSIIQGINASFSSQALEDCLIISIDSKKFRSIEMEFPSFLKISKHFTERMLIEREIREYNLLMLDGSERYQHFNIHFIPILSRLPKYLIASYLGITPESLSRIIKTSKKV